MRTSTANHSIPKEKIIVTAATARLYRQAAIHLARKYQRPPTAKSLIQLAVRRHSVSSILEDFYGWNELAKKYRPLTLGQLRRQVITSRRVE